MKLSFKIPPFVRNFQEAFDAESTQSIPDVSLLLALNMFQTL